MHIIHVMGSAFLLRLRKWDVDFSVIDIVLESIA